MVLPWRENKTLGRINVLDTCLPLQCSLFLMGVAWLSQ